MAVGTDAKALVEALSDSGRFSSVVTKKARVINIEGTTAWVSVIGGAPRTPCTMAVSCKANDYVMVTFADSRAIVTSNVTSPATDDTEANVASVQSDEAMEAASQSYNMANEARNMAGDASADAAGAMKDAETALGTAMKAETLAKAVTVVTRFYTVNESSTAPERPKDTSGWSSTPLSFSDYHDASHWQWETTRTATGDGTVTFTDPVLEPAFENDKAAWLSAFADEQVWVQKVRGSAPSQSDAWSTTMPELVSGNQMWSATRRTMNSGASEVILIVPYTGAVSTSLWFYQTVSPSPVPPAPVSYDPGDGWSLTPPAVGVDSASGNSTVAASTRTQFGDGSFTWSEPSGNAYASTIVNNVYELQSIKSDYASKSSLTQQADRITAEVNARQTTDGNVTALGTRVTQTETDISTEVSARQTTDGKVSTLETLIRDSSAGTLVAKVGQAYGALVNANGSFDVVAITWDGNTPTVGATLMTADSDGMDVNTVASDGTVSTAAHFGNYATIGSRQDGSTIGDMSISLGMNVIASGKASFASGGNISGSLTGDTTTKASGDYSHAEGFGTTAIGYASHAEGGVPGAYSMASGDASHAEGGNSAATGLFSHAEGGGGDLTNIASGDASHVEGYENTASGAGSHAEGAGNTASKNASHAEGAGNTASGPASHAEGYENTASGNYSHAEGMDNTASGYSSHAEGVGTVANHLAQHVHGRYNIEDNSLDKNDKIGIYEEIVGNGTSGIARSNARTLDWSGNEQLAGGIYVGATNANNVFTESDKGIDEDGVANLNGVKIDGEASYPTFTRTSWSTSSDLTTLPTTPCFVLSLSDYSLWYCDASDQNTPVNEHVTITPSPRLGYDTVNGVTYISVIED